MDVNKALEKLRESDRSLAARRKTLQKISNRLHGMSRHVLLVELARDGRLHDRLRCQVLVMLEESPCAESVRVMRELLHERSHSRKIRSQALYSLSLMEDPLIHVDLMCLLADPREKVWMRAEAAEKIGGLALERARGLLRTILENKEEAAEVLFWCLYACSGVDPDKGLKRLVKIYCEDQREVDPGMPGIARSRATLASEARWVLEHWKGLDTDPDWMLPEQDLAPGSGKKKNASSDGARGET